MIMVMLPCISECIIAARAFLTEGTSQNFVTETTTCITVKQNTVAILDIVRSSDGYVHCTGTLQAAGVIALPFATFYNLRQRLMYNMETSSKTTN